jgi:hypothetical protein
MIWGSCLLLREDRGPREVETSAECKRKMDNEPSQKQEEIPRAV